MIKLLEILKKPAKHEKNMRFENILVGSFLGALTGGSLVAWWFFDNLKDAKEIAEHSSYFADAQQGCLNSALIFASILCAMTIFER